MGTSVSWTGWPLFPAWPVSTTPHWASCLGPEGERGRKFLTSSMRMLQYRPPNPAKVFMLKFLIWFLHIPPAHWSTLILLIYIHSIWTKMANELVQVEYLTLKFIFKAKRWTCLFIFFRRTNNNKDVLCMFNYCRYADTPRGEHFSGHSDWIPEHSRGDEPAEFQAANEHLFRPAAHCQHLRGFWKVRSGGTGFNIIPAFSPHQHPPSDPLSESITKERTEVIFQGTLNQDPKDPKAVWEEYQFRCKPGDVYRRPCLISPYHYRLDWLMWFAAFQVSF